MYVALRAASIVEPHGFSGSLPVMIFLCVVNSEFIQANKDVLFCSVLNDLQASVLWRCSTAVACYCITVARIMLSILQNI